MNSSPSHSRSVLIQRWRCVPTPPGQLGSTDPSPTPPYEWSAQGAARSPPHAAPPEAQPPHRHDLSSAENPHRPSQSDEYRDETQAKDTDTNPARPALSARAGSSQTHTVCSREDLILCQPLLQVLGVEADIVAEAVTVSNNLSPPVMTRSCCPGCFSRALGSGLMIRRLIAAVSFPSLLSR